MILSNGEKGIYPLAKSETFGFCKSLRECVQVANPHILDEEWIGPLVCESGVVF